MLRQKSDLLRVAFLRIKGLAKLCFATPVIFTDQSENPVGSSILLGALGALGP